MVKVKVDGLIQKNFVEYSDSPSNAPLVPVMNKNGDIWLCFDYIKLNEKTVSSKFPISWPDKIYD